MLGVVMEEKELFDSALEGEFDDVVDAAVAPAAVVSVLLAIVLGVHDEDVNIFEEGGDFAVFVAGVFEFGSVAAAAELGVVTMAKMRFVVGKESNGTAGGGETISDANTGMVGHARFDMDGADAEGGLFEFFDKDIGGDFLKADREEGAFHLAGENVDEAVACAFVAEDAEAVLLLIDREKKWQALDVVPMGVGEKEG